MVRINGEVFSMLGGACLGGAVSNYIFHCHPRITQVNCKTIALGGISGGLLVAVFFAIDQIAIKAGLISDARKSRPPLMQRLLETLVIVVPVTVFYIKAEKYLTPAGSTDLANMAHLVMTLSGAHFSLRAHSSQIKYT